MIYSFKSIIGGASAPQLCKLYVIRHNIVGYRELYVLPPKFGPLPKPRLWYNIH